jgi:hypothetical protein
MTTHTGFSSHGSHNNDTYQKISALVMSQRNKNNGMLASSITQGIKRVSITPGIQSHGWLRNHSAPLPLFWFKPLSLILHLSVLKYIPIKTVPVEKVPVEKVPVEKVPVENSSR